MHVILANPRGFCAGVNMAVEALETALAAFGTPLYVYHEIVHNRPVVERFRVRGVVFVDSIEDVPEGGTVLYSAHGVSPVIREASASRRLRAIDATCPLVTKVHTEAIRYAKEGYTIVLIGHEGHDEVVGTMGEVPHSIVLVENEDDVARLSTAKRPCDDCYSPSQKSRPFALSVTIRRSGERAGTPERSGYPPRMATTLT